MELDLTEGAKLRLKRILELKPNMTERQAIEFAISTTWLVLEKRADPETRNRRNGPI